MQGEGLGRGGDGLNHRVSLDHGPTQRATGIVCLYNEFSHSHHTAFNIVFTIHTCTHSRTSFVFCP
jgi:hypothetical protein